MSGKVFLTGYKNRYQEMIQKVKQTPGAIGYVSDSDVTSDVKVLVIGK